MLLAILLSGPVMVTLPPKPVGPTCQHLKTVLVREGAAAPRAKPLGDDPPGQHILAVLRVGFDRCITAVPVHAPVDRR